MHSRSLNAEVIAAAIKSEEVRPKTESIEEDDPEESVEAPVAE